MANTDHWIRLDKQHCWHPFTQQKDWEQAEHQPVMLESADGVWLTDTEGNRYLDGNSSIWTNIHGHNHPYLNQAIQEQLAKVAHTSYLGFGHPLASELAQRLCHQFPENTLTRCFFSDDGSTAIECAIKMSIQSRQQSGEEARTRFLAFDNAYHGDTMGASSLGGVSTFFERFAKFGMPTHRLSSLEDLKALPSQLIEETTALIIEPLIQGVNQMNVWPEGMLKSLRDWTQQHGIHLILDEVMTGFGRTGTLFACQQEAVTPDFLCLAKGLTGGYLPMAATLTTEAIYDTFLGNYEDLKTFFYGHSYTANPLGCAAAMASLDLFEKEKTLEQLPEKIQHLLAGLKRLQANYPTLHDIRHKGLIFGIELRKSDGEPFEWTERHGAQFCDLLKKHGVLTRPILNTIVLMPPLSITLEEIDFMLNTCENSLKEFEV